MNLFDSHCHLENGRFETDLPEVMARMEDAGVRRCILAGSDMVSWVSYPKLEGDTQYALAEKYLPDGACGVVSFGVKGGRSAA